MISFIWLGLFEAGAVAVAFSSSDIAELLQGLARKAHSKIYATALTVANF
jgi:hypothetical protein